MASAGGSSNEDGREIEHEFLPFVRVYKDGTVDRLIDPPKVPPRSRTGVSSKDILISPDTGLSARIFLPTSKKLRLPILLYFHGGGFCVGSAFSAADDSYMASVSSAASVIAVSVEYRLAPSHPLPTAYDDCFSALQWLARHRHLHPDVEPWLAEHGDFDRVFLGGESAGGNIAHNVAMRAGCLEEGLPNGMTVVGLFMAMPFFWGSEPVGSEHEMAGRASKVSNRIWTFVYPSCPGGIDGKEVNPFGPGAPDVARIGCKRILVCVAGKDELRERGKWYVQGVKRSGFDGEVRLFEAKDEDHVFHIFKPDCDSAKEMLNELVAFINKSDLTT